MTDGNDRSDDIGQQVRDHLITSVEMGMAHLTRIVDDRVDAIAPHFDRAGNRIPYSEYMRREHEDPGWRRVARDEDANGYTVSTVLLPQPFPTTGDDGREEWLLFETMIFAPDGSVVEGWRRKTEEAAREIHGTVVFMVRTGVFEKIAKLEPDLGPWTCHVCGQERPDDKISVQKNPLPGLEAAFPSTCQNVRYCNDRSECAAKAPEVSFL